MPFAVRRYFSKGVMKKRFDLDSHLCLNGEFASIARKVVHKMLQALLYPIGCKVCFKTINYTLKGIIHMAKQ